MNTSTLVHMLLAILLSVQLTAGLMTLQPFPTSPSITSSARTALASTLLPAVNGTVPLLTSPTDNAGKSLASSSDGSKRNSLPAELAPLAFFLGLVAVVGICITSYCLSERFILRKRRIRDDEVELQGVTTINRLRETDRELLERIFEGGANHDGETEEEEGREGGGLREFSA